MTLEEVFNADRQRNTEINNLLQRIKYELCNAPGTKCVYLPTHMIQDGQPQYGEHIIDPFLLKELEKMGAIKIDKSMERSTDEMNEALEESKMKGVIVEGLFVEPIEPKFSQLCNKHEKLVNTARPPAQDVPEQNLNEDERVVTGKKIPVPRVTLSENQLCWQAECVPMGRGQGSVVKVLLDNRKEYHSNRLRMRKESVNMKVLMTQGGYSNETSFRDALNHIRRKIKKFPMKIENPKKNHYLLVIRYPNKSSRK